MPQMDLPNNNDLPNRPDNKTDRRISKRFDTDLPLLIKEPHKDGLYDAVCKDISADGARIISNKKLYEEDLLELTFEPSKERAPVKFLGNVRWARQVENDFCVAGLKFKGADLGVLSSLFRKV